MPESLELNKYGNEDGEDNSFWLLMEALMLFPQLNKLLIQCNLQVTKLSPMQQ
jgi:hypothetical protein